MQKISRLMFWCLVLCLIVLTPACAKDKTVQPPLDVWTVNSFHPEYDLMRINAIAICQKDPATVYLGAQNACVVRMKYAKDVIQNSFCFLPDKYEVAVPIEQAMMGSGAPGMQFIECLAVDPVHSKTLYIGFAGIFKSLDGGESWVQVYSRPTVRSLLVDPKDSSIIYAGTEMAGLLKSSDSGETWKKVLNGIYFIVLRADQNDGTLLAGGAFGFFKSTDQGENWTKLSDMSISSLAISPVNSLILYACPGFNRSDDVSVYKSADGGKTWALLAQGFAGNESVQVVGGRMPLVIDPQNPSVLYAGTMGAGIFKSMDGGDTWKPFSNGLPETDKEIFSLAINPNNPLIVYAGTGNGKMFRIVQSK